MKDKPLYTNRLSKETSPYLLQHAHNPVDWYPWGDEAFQIAKEKDLPIFLSIGYSTCHWCHVMEKECFHNVEIAKKMNEAFVNVKVDREEMPEIDSLYMEFAQAIMSGGAGWPLNLILTPDLTPFFASTYLPPDSQKGFMGLKQLIDRISAIWNDPEEREMVFMQAGKIVELFQKQIKHHEKKVPSTEMLQEAAYSLFKVAEPVFGGMKGAPKFPIGFQAIFLSRFAKRFSESRALFYVERSLEMMHRGGIYDHLGGGFSRYAIDERWIVPHFEKMLPDNAILSRVYAEMYAYTRNTFYKEIAIEVLDYIERELFDPRGFFYAAIDADMKGKEGEFYTWSWEEIAGVLKDDAPLFCEFFGASPTGNFRGKNILHMPYGLNEFSDYRRLDRVILEKMIKDLRYKLLQERKKRDSPTKDDKVVLAYNSLAISTFVNAGGLFQKMPYFEKAVQTARFLKEHLYQDGKLLRSWREGEANHPAILDDYAFFISALVQLYEKDLGEEWLELAIQLEKHVHANFLSEDGGYYLTDGSDPNLILRREEFYDGSEPSGNGVQAENLLKLYQLTANHSYLQKAENIFCAAKDAMQLFPPGASYHMMALLRYYDQNAPVAVIVLNEKEEFKEEIHQMIGASYSPHLVTVWHRPHKKNVFVPDVAKGKQPINGCTTLYVCYGDRCLEPVSDLSKMWEVFDQLK
jgi:uncharacterized protein